MNDVAFPRRPRRRRSPSIASARRTWERDVRKVRPLRAYPGQWSTSPALAAADLRRAIATFEAHYLGTATVRVS